MMYHESMNKHCDQQVGESDSIWDGDGRVSVCIKHARLL